MVHVKKCQLGKKRVPITRFLRDGVPQVYCRGYRLPENGYKISDTCMKCMDWSGGEQCQKDYIAAQHEGKAKVLFTNENPVYAEQ